MNQEELHEYILKLKADPTISTMERIRLWHEAMPKLPEEEKQGLKEALEEKMEAVTRAREESMSRIAIPSRH